MTYSDVDKSVPLVDSDIVDLHDGREIEVLDDHITSERVTHTKVEDDVHGLGCRHRLA